MFCRNCGKSIPDDSKFCPYCGASTNLEEATTTTVIKSESNSNQTGGQPATFNKQLTSLDVIKNKFDKLSPEKIEKFLTFNKIFKASAILSFIGILVYFAGTPIFSSIDSHSSQGALTFQKIYIWFTIIYSLVLIATSILNIVLVVKYKKDFDLKNIKALIVAKSVYIALLLALSIMLILNVTGILSTKETSGEIPTLILSGLCFVISGLSGTLSQAFTISKKVLKQIYPDRFK